MPDLSTIPTVSGRRWRRLITSISVATLVAGGAVVLTPGAAFALPIPPSATGSSGISPATPVDESGTPIGKITAVEHTGAAVTLTAEKGAARVTFLDAASFRVEVDPSGTFTDPANTSQNDPARSANIIVGLGDFDGADVTVTDGATITIATSAATLTIDKATATMALHRADGTLLWQEAHPITFGGATATQYLERQEGEQFIGGGMQNGRSVHTEQTINVSQSTKWDDGGHPNAVPYYMSSAGYGVLRDTFKPGSYTFMSDITTTHAERRFDAFYFVGDYKTSLDSYTKLTGRPMMPPVYALEYGDADCYNRSNPTYSSSGYTSSTPKQHTYDALLTAKEFVTNDMPAGWMLVNDGYGCEYTADPDPMDPANPGEGLTGTVQAIASETGLQTGLWTQRSLTKQEYEVGTAGISMRKLDVAWVGEGYRLALTGCESAHSGIEQYSDRRGMSLMVEGWAGSQRCGMQWTGDHTGTVDSIKWQIPALAGSGNAGLAFTTADVDGIFGGSTESYVRDLQWKAFAPALYSMSGWAPTDKRPWLYGEAATRINRDYLQLRQKLMPFIYSLSVDAHRTGVSPMRSMALEFPGQTSSYSADSAYQFMLGSSLLVAPVYSRTDTRNGIELPAGERWVDYWSGEVRAGGSTLNGYDAPLDTVPVFVKAGSIIPEGLVARNASLVPEDSPLTLDVYPSGEASFVLNEDDKVSRAYQNGASSAQTFTATAPEKNAGDVVITIGERVGDYAGKAAARPYALDVHTGSVPASVNVGDTVLAQAPDQAAFEAAETGWIYDDAEGGVVKIKAGSVASSSAAVVTLTDTSAVGGRDSDATAATLALTLPARGFQGQSVEAVAAFTNTGDQAKTDVTITPTLPEGWTIAQATGDTIASVAAGETATATFELVPGSSGPAGTVKLTASAVYVDATGAERTVTGANTMEIAYGSLRAAVNSVSVTTVAGRATGDFDGGGASFSAEQLATATLPAGGVRPGSAVTVSPGLPEEVTFTWPDAGADVPNAVQPAGQTIALSGTGSHLAILASAASGSGVSPTFTITYTDGTVQQAATFYPNWVVQASGIGSATVAIASLGRNNANNPASPEYTSSKYQVYSNSIRLLSGKTVASVTLPTESRVKLFDWQLIDLPDPESPTADAFVSDLAWQSATTGWGVIGKDVANKDAASSPDVPLTIAYTGADGAPAETTYAKGLGVHAASKVSYFVGGSCTRFTAEVGIEKGFDPKMIFTVWGDGRQLYTGKTLTRGMAPEAIDIDLTGVDVLDLRVDPIAGGSINGAHAIWGDARVACGSTEPVDTTAPVTTATLTPEAAASGWYTSAPTLTLTAQDDSDIAGISYARGDDEHWSLYETPLTFGEGVHTVRFAAADVHQNEEEPQSLTLSVDTIAATLTPSVSERTLTLTASDAGSGVAKIEYSTDGVTWKAYDKPIVAGDDGLVVDARVSDVAGNITALTEAVVIAPVPVEEAIIDATASVTCSRGKAVVEVTVTNRSTSAVKVVIDTAFGDKKIGKLRAGASETVTLKTKKATVAAGEATVTASAKGGASPAPIVVAQYAATSCR